MSFWDKEKIRRGARSWVQGRSRDVVVHAAVVPKPMQRVTRRKLSSSTLNTGSEFEANAAVAHKGYGNQKIVGLEEVPGLTVGQVLEVHCRSCPDLVSPDIEGMDLPVLRTRDFKRWRPKMFIVETLRFCKDGRRQEKVAGIGKAFAKAGYSVYADTFINTLYVEGDPLRVPGWNGHV